MAADIADDPKLANLRKRAEERLGAEVEKIKDLSPDEISKIVHDLRTHQIELEMQNEELRRAQVELEQSRHRYSDLYDFAPVGYLTVSDKGLIVEANLAAASMFGVERRYLINRSIHSFLTGKEQGSHYICRKRLIETKEGQACERRMIRKDGSDLFIHFSCVIRPEVDGDSGQFRMVVTDISQRKAIEHERNRLDLQRRNAEQELRKYSINLEELVDKRTAELKESQKELIRQERLAAIGRLSGCVAHDIRNPLGAISNSIYFLGLAYKDTEDEQLWKHIGIMDREIHRANDIISGLMDFTRINEPVFTKEQINLTLSEVIKEIDVPEGITVETELDPSIPALFFDKSQIRRVSINLILNAIQAMPETGLLKISSSVSEGFAEIKIQDSGGGISEEELEKIFEPLFTSKSKGVGLGLSIVKSFVEKHNGIIDVASEVGKGTTFTVKLPTKQKEAS